MTSTTRIFAMMAAMLATACSQRPDDEPAAGAAGNGGATGSSFVAPPARVSSGTWDERLTVGQTVEIAGTFVGNDPESVCAFTSTTRSRPRRGTDWLIRSDGRCMWVGDGHAIFGDPEAILSRDSVGRRVAITATVQSDDTGRFYLGFVEGRAE